MLRRTLAGLAAAALVAAASAALPTSAGAAPDPDVIPGSYIVTLRDGDPDEVAKEHGNKYGASVDHVYRSALRGYAAHMSAQSATRVAEDDRVAAVVADRVVTLAKGKPGGGTPPPPPASTEVVPTGVLRIGAPVDGRANLPLDGLGSVDVAVIDTGSGPHGDLNIAGGYNCSSGTSYADGNGHGTHVAGTIGALNNTIGVVGVAPGARIWSVRVLNAQGSGSWSSIICGVNWIMNKGIEVANMSLGGTGSDAGGCGDNGMQEAICNAVESGITFVVAAGNESDDAANHVPAAYDEVITVSALADFDGASGGAGSATCRADEDDTLANFSNFGPDVDLIAPGVCIKSTWKGGGYNTISGTSMASPHVAGAAALYRASVAGANASPLQVKEALIAAANDDWDNGDDRDLTKEPLVHT